jgi:hypothetical protein
LRHGPDQKILEAYPIDPCLIRQVTHLALDTDFNWLLRVIKNALIQLLEVSKPENIFLLVSF